MYELTKKAFLFDVLQKKDSRSMIEMLNDNHIDDIINKNETYLKQNYNLVPPCSLLRELRSNINNKIINDTNYIFHIYEGISKLCCRLEKDNVVGTYADLFDYDKEKKYQLLNVFIHHFHIRKC
ncbi:hypothetical protein WA158_005442 [Blastocystis sp. Blastoise]